jgi:YbbR domain-containing protein
MRWPGFLTRNIRLKAVAAVVATITWAGVVYASNPPDTRSVSVKVPQDPNAVTPYILVHSIPDLVIRVSGTREHLNAFDPAAVIVSVNYHAITRTGLQSVPLSVINNDRDVVLDNPPTSVVAEVDHVDSQNVPVTIVQSSPPPQGYVVGPMLTTPGTVTLIGPQHQLPGLQARVTVDLSGQKTNYQADLQVVIYDSSNHRLGNIGTNITVGGKVQTTVQVSIQITAVQTSRASAVLPQTSGTVAPGHMLSSVRVNFPTVVLSGPQDLLNTLDSVSTDTISLSGLTGTVSFTVKLRPPAGVVAAPSTVTVTLNVVALPTATAPPTATPSPAPVPTPTPT